MGFGLELNEEKLPYAQAENIKFTTQNLIPIYLNLLM
jgi:hypothetical protein